MTTLTHHEPLTPGQELVQGAYESGIQPMRQPRRKSLQEAYGFDDVAIVPGVLTINPELTDVSTELAGQRLEIPILASAMDAVVDPHFAVEVGRRGGMAVLNLEGLQCRFDDPAEVLQEVAGSDTETATAILQRAYMTPIRDELVGLRVQEIKDGGVAAAVSVTPPNAKRLASAIKDAAPDVFVVQSTVTTARHYSRSERGLILRELIKDMGIPTLVGNTVGFEASLELMEEGIAGLLVGVGPGAACTSREVLGIGVPQVSATIECAYARDIYFERTGRYVPIITDGGIRYVRAESKRTFYFERTGLCADHHRRRDSHGRRFLQGAGLGRGRGHDWVAIRRSSRSAGPGLPLGHGDATRRTAARRSRTRGSAHDAGSAVVRSDIEDRRYGEPDRRAADLHG